MTRVSLHPGCADSSAGGQPAAQAHVQRAVSGAQPSTHAPPRGCGCGHRASAVARRGGAPASVPGSGGGSGGAQSPLPRSPPALEKFFRASWGWSAGRPAQPCCGTMHVENTKIWRGKWDRGRVREGCRGPAFCPPGRDADCSVHIAHHTAAVMVRQGFGP